MTRPPLAYEAVTARAAALTPEALARAAVSLAHVGGCYELVAAHVAAQQPPAVPQPGTDPVSSKERLDNLIAWLNAGRPRTWEWKTPLLFEPTEPLA